MANVFVSGATGYLGSRLIPVLAGRGHTVKALSRKNGAIPHCETVKGDALSADSFSRPLAGCDTLVHLTGTPRPTPWKEREFRAVDLPSLIASAEAARQAGTVRHFIYVSVAQPAPVMKAYQRVRGEAENHLAGCGFGRTILRPWYVLGPGHWWPLALLPVYAVAERLPAARQAALRLGLVTVAQMIAALVQAVEQPVRGCRLVETPAIRLAALTSSPARLPDDDL